ncbi:MAG: hypothetical protein CMJ18_14205 [Phycisphaeraceae bacterium]|nr:hypothetical protein [Phycisphaeraceae bacterium]
MIRPARRLRTDSSTAGPAGPAAGAYTTIELVTVIVIIAILAVVASPTLSSINDTRAAMAARLLLKDLTFARQRAVATGTTTWVVFDTNAESWSILGEDPASPGRSGATVLTDPVSGDDDTRVVDTGSFAGVQLISAAVDGDVEVGFDWLGRPFNASETAIASAGVITLTGNHVVNVAVSTGHITYTAP